MSKIILINVTCGSGSTGKITTDYYKTYKQQGNEVKIIYGRGEAKNVEKNDAICFNNKLDFYYHIFISRIFDSQGLHSKIATKKIIKYIKKFNPDMIHLHNIHGYYLNYKILFEYLNSTNIRIIWTLHDCWTYTGHCAHYLYNNCYKWKTECINCKFKKDYPKSVLFSNAKRNFKLKKKLFSENTNMTLITPSNWLKIEVEQSFMNVHPIEIVNNKINTNIFKPTPSNIKQELGIRENQKVVLGVASVWTDKKGYNYFLNLAKKLNEDYKIVLVGLNDKQLKVLPKNIIGIKRTESMEKLAKIYTMADVNLIASYEETFGLTILESQACGAKVICFANSGGCEEIIGGNDILLKDRKIETLIKVMEKI